MIRIAALALVGLTLLAGRAALACPEPAPTLLWHSCWGEASITLRLLPEDLPFPEPEAERLLVTGAYTARAARESGHPEPVGLFVRGGELVGRHLARMDGILVIAADGRSARIAHRKAVPLGGASYDLTSFDERARFLTAAVAAGLSLMQSHLLVVRGRSDVAEVENAPAHVRRLIFEDAHGIGVWQTRWPVTLHEAARAVIAEVGPRMAMNLDMGSFDFCLAEVPGEPPRACGVISPGGTEVAKLSNLLDLRLRRAPL